MATDLNVVTLTGRLVRDPELRSFQSGKSVASARIAVNSTSKKDGQWEDQGHFFDITVWEPQAENFVKKAKQGHRLAITGRLQQRTWEAQDGTKRERVGITVDRVHYLQETTKARGAAIEAQNAQRDEDVPF